jgi:hypothetical protein
VTGKAKRRSTISFEREAEESRNFKLRMIDRFKTKASMATEDATIQGKVFLIGYGAVAGFNVGDAGESHEPFNHRWEMKFTYQKAVEIRACTATLTKIQIDLTKNKRHHGAELPFLDELTLPCSVEVSLRCPK